MQVATGVLIGTVPGSVLLAINTAETGTTSWLVALGTLASAAFVLIVALLACAVPARRALQIQPTEALRAEA
jgi:ABC-type antimicrobial peptide transport system permease subunit